MQSQFLKTIHEQGRREEILRFAARFLGEEPLEELRQIEELDELEQAAFTLIEQRKEPAANDDE